MAMMIRSAAGKTFSIKSGDRLGTVDVITSLAAVKRHFEDKLDPVNVPSLPLQISPEDSRRHFVTEHKLIAKTSASALSRSATTVTCNIVPEIPRDSEKVYRIEVKRRAGDNFLLDTDRLDKDDVAIADDVRIKVRNNGIVTGHFHPGDVVATASVKYSLLDNTEYKVYKLFAKPPSSGHRMQPGALISMECRAFLSDKESFVSKSSLEIVHLFKLPEGLKMMTEVRTFTSSAKVFLIFKNIGKKDVSDFPELMPVALVRAHVHSRPVQPCKKNTPPLCELDIADDDDDVAQKKDNTESSQNKDKKASDENEITEITIE